MSESPNYFNEARSFAIDILRRQSDRTPAKIEQIAAVAKQAIRGTTGAEVDEALLVSELLHLFSIQVDAATILEDHDPSRHVPWLPSRRASIKWNFWERYSTYLRRDIGIAPGVVDNLGDLTEMIIERLEDPKRDGPWDRRGMVVGSVQSGKTANYIGVINKALDAGYKLVVVLAGIHSNLRSQTQLRVDEGVLGFDTKKSRRLNQDSRRIGVGRQVGDTLFVHSLTSSAEDGDFNLTMAEIVGVMIGGDPVVLVVKKNVKVLSNLIKWIKKVSKLEKRNDKDKIVGTPLLVIDDEADNASINTKTKNKNRGSGSGSDARSTTESVTAINGQIRSLLDLFDKSAYVGYTATPFANIFINPDAETPDHGEDLFPRSFIINVQPPSNYVGPARLFGLKGDPDADIPASEALPIVRQVDDYQAPDCFPVNHKKDHRPKRLPDTLLKAIRCFLLASAARRARGQGQKHHSMLVHVTRFIDVQTEVVNLIKKEVLSLQRRLAFGDGARVPTAEQELRKLWEEEFEPTTSFMMSEESRLSWPAIVSQLHNASSKITVMPINGFAKEALDYKEHEQEGISVIAVGGDKLSRGLTLEGLSTSYFLRTSKMYDTLMQMGRWFGYRDGYLEFCRVFTTKTLVDWYRHIALAELELRREFDYMVAAGLTPEQYGLRVRTHPDGMVVTALNKMSHSQKLELSWEGVLVQTAHIPKREGDLEVNCGAVEQLVAHLGEPLGDSDGLKTKLWMKVEPSLIARMVESLRYPAESARASGPQLASFIRQESRKQLPELTEWSVALISNSNAKLERRSSVDRFEVGLLERSAESQTETAIALRKANLISPMDQSLDLRNTKLTPEYIQDLLAQKAFLAKEVTSYSEDAGTVFDLALALTRARIAAGSLKGSVTTTVPNGRVVRELRLKQSGLLLIYPLARPLVVLEAEGRNEQTTGFTSETPPIFGLALSFPTSDSTVGVEYQVNAIWGEDDFEDDLYEE